MQELRRQGCSRHRRRERDRSRARAALRRAKAMRIVIGDVEVAALDDAVAELAAPVPRSMVSSPT